MEYGTGAGGGGGSGGGSGAGSGSESGDGSGGGGDSGSGSGSETTPDTLNLPGISNGNGGVTITSAAVMGRSNPMQHYCTKLLILLLGMGLGLWSNVIQEGF